MYRNEQQFGLANGEVPPPVAYPISHEPPIEEALGGMEAAILWALVSGVVTTLIITLGILIYRR